MPYDDPEALQEDARDVLNTLKILIKRGMPYTDRPIMEDTAWVRTLWPNEWYL